MPTKKSSSRSYSPKDQAFFVLAHELGHLAAGHWERADDERTRAQRHFWADGGPGLELERLESLGDRASAPQRRRLTALKGQLAALDERGESFGFPLEQEADARAVAAAAGSGADPAAGAGFMLNMVDVYARTGMRFDAASHGSPQSRAARIRELAAGYAR